MILLISVTVFLIYMNVPVVLVTDYGVPKALALMLPLLLAAPVAYRILVRHEALRFPSMIVIALLMLACHTVSALVSARPHVGLESVFTWLTEGVLLAFLLVNALRTRREVFFAAGAIVLAGAVMGLIVVLQQILGPTNYPMAGFGKLSSGEIVEGVYRLSGPIGEKNRFAQIMAVLIPVAVGLAVTGPRRQRWLFGIAALLITAGVALSYSRGALVALFLIIPFVLMFRLLRLRHFVIAGICGLLLISTAPFFTPTAIIAQRVESLGIVVVQSLGLRPGGLRNTDGAARGRLTSMKAAGLLFLDHPILGAGPGLAPVYYQDYSILVGGKVRASERRAHNLYLQLAAETGVIGLAAYLAMLAVVLLPLDRARRRTEFSDRQLWGLLCGLELGLLIFLATSVFLHAAYIRYCWLYLALIVAATMLPCRAIEPENLRLVMRQLRRYIEQRPRALPGKLAPAGGGGA